MCCVWPPGITAYHVVISTARPERLHVGGLLHFSGSAVRFLGCFCSRQSASFRLGAGAAAHRDERSV
eukprot:6173482-Pleurochrysis_carterae.AAC.1